MGLYSTSAGGLGSDQPEPEPSPESPEPAGRRWWLCVLLPLAGLALAGAGLLLVYRAPVSEALGSIVVDPRSPTHAAVCVGLGLGLFLLQLVGMAWWTFAAAYFWRLRVMPLCLATAIGGVALNFSLGRALSRFPAVQGWCEPGDASYQLLRSRIERSPIQVAGGALAASQPRGQATTLLFMLPIPGPLLCTLLGLAGEAQAHVVLAAGALVLTLHSIPVALAANALVVLVEAFDQPGSRLLAGLLALMAVCPAGALCEPRQVGIGLGLRAFSLSQMAKLRMEDEQRPEDRQLLHDPAEHIDEL